MNSKIKAVIQGVLFPTHRLSTKLSLSILLFAVPIFVLSLGVLFTQSRHIIRTEAVGRANSVLTTTMQRVCRKLAAIETATNSTSWMALQPLHPDSLLELTNRVVRLNPHVDGCSISAEPDVFPEYGRYFSVYSIREGESIISVVEEQYEYFVKNWYKKPHDLGKTCWVDFYDETDSLEVTLSGMIASYGKPIYNDEGQLVAIMSTDISLKRLSKTITEEKPYPNSYFIMTDESGRYIIHPDSAKLFSHSIFDIDDPQQQADIIALGHQMTSGNDGTIDVIIDQQPCLVCYQHVPGTEWSMALICPEKYVLQKYHRLTYIIGTLLLAGLLLILLLSHRAVAHAIRPLNQLLTKTQTIASGNMEVYIPRSDSEDAVGQLQNSFSTMLQFLNFHMGSVRYTTDQTKRRNEELEKATELAEEADKQKTIFIQNVSHQIRTPLNIIMGFAQVLSPHNSHLSSPTTTAPAGSPNEDEKSGVDLEPTLLSFTSEEMKRITDTMQYNTVLLTRLVLMLVDSSDIGLEEERLTTTKLAPVNCNEVAKEAINYIHTYHPQLNIRLQSDVDDNFCIQTSRLYLIRSLRELLYNSAKHSDQQHISLRITVHPSPPPSTATDGFAIDTPPPTIQFIVEDTGKGIPKNERQQIFKFFTKIDDLSEGLGLGLPLAKRHAQNLGGDLILDEDYHDGCRFIIELPC